VSIHRELRRSLSSSHAPQRQPLNTTARGFWKICGTLRAFCKKKILTFNLNIKETKKTIWFVASAILRITDLVSNPKNYIKNLVRMLKFTNKKIS
jgi:hypothetical protein